MSADSVRDQIARRFVPVVGGDEPGWVTADTLASTDDPVHLDSMLAAQRRGPRAHTDTAAGSLLMLEYARLLSWPVLAARLADGATLDPAPADVAVRPAAFGPGGLAFRRPPRPAPPPVDPREPAPPHDLVDGLVDHLVRLAEAIRRRVRIGRRTLHGDLASALAGGLLALSWMHPPRDRYRPVASAVLERNVTLRGLADITAIDHDDDTWMVVRRRTCCLAYGTATAPDYCGTCPILDEDDRVERFHRTAARYLVLTGPTQDTT